MLSAGHQTAPNPVPGVDHGTASSPHDLPGPAAPEPLGTAVPLTLGLLLVVLMGKAGARRRTAVS